MKTYKVVIKILNLINAEMNEGSKDYDSEFIRNHVEKLTSLIFHTLLVNYNTFQNLNFEVLNLDSILVFNISKLPLKINYMVFLSFYFYVKKKFL